MKIFAIMLLMLYSGSCLKAQTMVVETADSVVSFEVREIKSLSVFGRKHERINIEYKNVPITIKHSNGDSENRMYNSWQTLEPYPKPVLKGDTLFKGNGAGGMQFCFITLGSKTGSSPMGCEGKIGFSNNNISSFYFTTYGSGSGCSTHPKETCITYGNFTTTLKNIEFKIDSLGIISAELKNLEIQRSLQTLIHSERIEYYGGSGYKREFLKIREEDLTDDSQIIITIE